MEGAYQACLGQTRWRDGILAPRRAAVVPRTLDYRICPQLPASLPPDHVNVHMSASLPHLPRDEVDQGKVVTKSEIREDWVRVCT